MLIVRDVKIEYYGEELATLNFSFDRGVTMIVGQVGSFKTSLMRVIGGIKEISSGEVILDDRNIEEIPPKKRDMAYVGRDSFPLSGSVKRALMLPLKLRKSKNSALLAEQAADNFGLELRAKVKRLDAAQKVNFFAARLSLRQTEVTMFDEPFEYLGREKTVLDMIRSRGGYVLVSACDGEMIGSLLPDFLVIVRGDKILRQGKTEEVLSSELSDYERLLLGQ